jgi:hypothetical protein
MHKRALKGNAVDEKTIKFWVERAKTILEIQGCVTVTDLTDMGVDRETADLVIRRVAESDGNERMVIRKPGGRG